MFINVKKSMVGGEQVLDNPNQHSTDSTDSTDIIDSTDSTDSTDGTDSIDSTDSTDSRQHSRQARRQAPGRQPGDGSTYINLVNPRLKSTYD
jgi:hypothetical protein